jgi:hypothetical protein
LIDQNPSETFLKTRIPFPHHGALGTPIATRLRKLQSLAVRQRHDWTISSRSGVGKLNRSDRRDFLRCGGQARTVSPADVTAVGWSQLTYSVEVAAEPLADVEQTVRSVHQA